MKKKILIAGFALLHSISYSQVNPVVTGDTMLCPEGTGMLTTGTFDTYQWFQRYYMTEDTFAISGATSQTLDMSYYDFAGSYVMVEVTQGGITVQSDEILVDGYAFTSPLVSMSGDFQTGENGEAILCTGDTLTLQFLQPYTQFIKWYDDGNPIPGETDSILFVTTEGSYTVSGSPELCPEYVAGMYIPIEVLIDNCGLGVGEKSFFTALYPNPAKDRITLTLEQQPKGDFTLIDQSGRIVRTAQKTGLTTEIELEGLRQGVYFIEAEFETGKQVERFVIE